MNLTTPDYRDDQSAELCLFPFQETGRPAIHYVHDVSGSVLNFARIAGELAEDHDVIGLQCLGLDLVSPADQTIEEMAGRYADTRRQLNQTFYQRFSLNDDNQVAVTNDVLDPPFDEIVDASWAYQRQKQLAFGNRLKTRPNLSLPAGEGRNKNGPGHTTGPLENDQTPVLADIFQVNGSSKRVMVGRVGLEPTTQGL